MNFYNIKTVKCNDRIEVYKYSRAITEGRTNNVKGRTGKHDIEDRKTEKNRKETLNKARNEIIRLVKCNQDMTTFITLTYAENMKDIKQSKDDLSKCFRLLQKYFPGFKYLYVLEFQERGAIHYHVLCNLLVPVKTAKSKKLKPNEQKDFENYFEEVFWNHGFVDIRDLEQEGNTNAGLYVSVYLVEDLYNIDLGGNKCYGFSRNLNKPVINKQYINMSSADIVLESNESYDIYFISNYKIEYTNGTKTYSNAVTYFDMCRKEQL